MRHHSAIILFTSLLASVPALSQEGGSVYSESRDAAAAYVGTTNFIVGRLGRDCLQVFGRSQSPQEFVQAWQQRNAKYVSASFKYMGKRLDEALASGGTEKRDAVLREYSFAVRRNGETAVRGWFARGTVEEVCKRVTTLVEAGGMDISAQMPMFDELEALAS